MRERPWVGKGGQGWVRMGEDKGKAKGRQGQARARAGKGKSKSGQEWQRP